MARKRRMARKKVLMVNKDDNVVEVHVTGVSLTGESGLKNDSERSAGKDQGTVESTEDNNSE